MAYDLIQVTESWPHAAAPVCKFVRVGTLDQPDLLPPDIHICTGSQQAWVMVPPATPATPAFEAYCERGSIWPAESLARRQAMLPLIEPCQAGLRRDA